MQNIDYSKVYSDGVTYSWISIKDGEYIFNNLNSCSINRMGINHILKVIDNDLITFNFIDINKAILITDKKDKNWKFLILPQRQ